MTALVTGSAHRVGRALAMALAADGWLVALHYRNSPKDAEAVAKEIKQAGGHAVTIGADLSKEADVQTLIPRLIEGVGPLGLLVNNASMFEKDAAMTVTRASWDLHMETNLRAPFVLSQGFAAQLPDGHSGSIVNIVDQRVWNLTPHFTSYTVSKAALWTLTQTLALALAPRIRVNAIGPGPTLPSKHQSAEEFEEQCRSMPLMHGPALAELAAALKFILASPSMTGQLIALDGGQHLLWAAPTGTLED
jgi:NAD(P)-dependent dehydrogenase (short-subunit alcohol dehydrogenase family)